MPIEEFGYNASAYADGGLGAMRWTDPTLTLLYQFAKDRTLVASKSLGPTLAITRATEGRFFDAAGILQTAASGVARFDHNPATGESLGLLIEEARTNLMLQSQDVSAAPWTTLLTPVINIDSSIAPDGTLTMNSINDNNGAGFEAVVQQITIPDDSANYTFSMYIEKTAAGTAPTMGVNIVLIGGTNPGDLPIPRIFTDTGFVQDLQAGTNSRIEDAGDYWRLISTVGNNSTGHTIIEVQIYPATAANGFLPNLASAVGINRVWGMQMEVGLFATSYTPTLAASVTRNADVVSTTDVSWLNASAGTVYSRSSALEGRSGASDIYDISAGASTKRILVQGATNGNGTFFVVDTTTLAQIVVSSVWNDTALHETASAWAVNDAANFIDGTAGTPDTALTIPSVSKLNIGSRFDGTAEYWNGHIAEIRYYNVRKVNQFLEDLSNGLLPI